MGIKPEIIGLGEIALDWVDQIQHFPSPDEKIDASSQNFFTGGVTANFLTGAARLGASTGFLGAVGEDEYGQFLLDGMASAGIDASYVLRKDKSAVNFIMVAQDSGEKIIIQSPYMQTTKLEVGEIDEDYFSDAKSLHTTAIHTDLTLHCLEIAKRNKITVSLDLEKQIAVRGLNVLQPIIENVDILLPNKEGAKTLTGENNIEEAAKKFLEWGPRVVIITLGGDGCLVTTETMQERVPAYKVDVIDTTGAGDAFCASFIVAHVIKGMDVMDAALLANAVAAIKVQHLGATSGLPTWEEALEFQAAHEIN
ncbi:MAG TPA: carbohydrate kinase family protein [Candidatus Lokiarchaeia archaeon]|nr:carbohydrate kinase family protein [Candidatus Lokiarchaeia archaeon]